MSDSGPPAHWPFAQFDPATFRVPKRKVERVFLHCTANDNHAFRGVGLAEEINRWHLMNGWRGVGYHYLIDKEGFVVTGRPVEETPAAQLGKDNLGNVATIAISTHGMWEFTEKSLESVVAMCRAIDQAYKLDGQLKKVTFHGHCEIDPRPCPVYDYKSLLGLDKEGNLFSGMAETVERIAQRATIAGKLKMAD